jgi:hypothetical protein
MENQSPFSEKSGFPAWIFLSMLSIPTILYLHEIITNPKDVEPFDWIGFIILAIVGLFIYSIKLKVSIDQKGITYQYPPFRNKPTTLPWEDIQTVELLKINPLKEFGGWGLRYGKLGAAYTTRGRYILHIKTQKKTPINLTVVDRESLIKISTQNQWPITDKTIENCTKRPIS